MIAFGGKRENGVWIEEKKAPKPVLESDGEVVAIASPS
jgi:hypothetical protein